MTSDDTISRILLFLHTEIITSMHTQTNTHTQMSRKEASPSRHRKGRPFYLCDLSISYSLNESLSSSTSNRSLAVNLPLLCYEGGEMTWLMWDLSEQWRNNHRPYVPVRRFSLGHHQAWPASSIPLVGSQMELHWVQSRVPCTSVRADTGKEERI